MAVPKIKSGPRVPKAVLGLPGRVQHQTDKVWIPSCLLGNSEHFFFGEFVMHLAGPIIFRSLLENFSVLLPGCPLGPALGGVGAHLGRSWNDLELVSHGTTAVPAKSRVTPTDDRAVSLHGGESAS